MKRRTNVINNVLYLALTMLTLFLVVYFCNGRFKEDMFMLLLMFAVGTVVAGITNTFAHELGHLFAGKKNGFAFSSINVWFFKWTKVKKRIRFDFVMIGEEAGYTEMIPTTCENLDMRLSKMTKGGLVASFIMMFVGVPPLFINGLSAWIYCIWSMFLPVGVYFFFGNALPMTNDGVLNDGGVVSGIKNKTDSMVVALSVLAVQAEMYSGKLPSEIDEKLYFELPQLPEDDPNFALLLNARYLYYLDKEDYMNAKKVSDRLISIVEYMPKSYQLAAKTDALYNACTFDFNEEVADDLMYELEKFLNNVNTSTTVRAKLAYILNVKGEKDCFDIFYNKGVKEADRCQIKGFGEFEKKLLESLKKQKEQK